LKDLLACILSGKQKVNTHWEWFLTVIHVVHIHIDQLLTS